MRVLLDSHVLLWWATGGAQISPSARGLIEDPTNDALVSAGSLYEIATKARIGRLDLPGDAETYLPQLVRRFGFGILPVHEHHALRAAGLPVIHRDPWDRLLVGQAQVEGIPIITADPQIGQYDVRVVW